MPDPEGGPDEGDDDDPASDGDDGDFVPKRGRGGRGATGRGRGRPPKPSGAASKPKRTRKRRDSMPAGADPDEVPDLVESDDEDELEAADVRVRPHDEGSDEEAEPVTQDGWRWGVGEPAAGKGPAINPQGIATPASTKNIPTRIGAWKLLDIWTLFMVIQDTLAPIVAEINRYAASKKDEEDEGGRTWDHLTVHEFGKYLAIVLTMGVCKLPSVPLYFQEADLGILGGARLNRYMTLKRFQQITRFLHFRDSTQRPADPRTREHRLWQLDWLERFLNGQYKKYFVPSGHMALDERSIETRHQMCPVRCYCKDKPNKFHIRKYCLCDIHLGYIWHAETYDKLPEVGHVTAVTQRLSDTLPREGCTVATDRYYTGVENAVRLAAKGHDSVGTIMTNRKGIPWAELKALVPRKPAQGWWCWAYNEETGVSVVGWQDRQLVWLCGSGVPIKQVMVSRHGGRTADRVQVPAPYHVVLYWSMYKAVDIKDMHCAEYNVQSVLPTQMWFHRPFFGMLSETVSQAHNIHTLLAGGPDEAMSHMDFHLKLATKLMHNKWDGAALPIDSVGVAVMPGRGGRHSGTHTTIERIPFKGEERMQAQCEVCTATKPKPKPGEPRLPRTDFWCPECNVALHRECFAAWHAPPGKIPGLNALKGKQRAMVPLTERSEAGRKWAAKRATRAQTAAGPSRR
eukprot:jgi/Mesvir1/23441/Mv26031-RA.1